MPDPNALSLPALYQRLASTGLIRRLLELARDEDLGVGPNRGDITSAVCLTPSRHATANLVARAGGVISGLTALPELIEAFGGRVAFSALTQDGDRVPTATTIAVLSGPEQDLLTLERTALNLIGRLSGIATRTAEFVSEMTKGDSGGMRARLYDTRKTTPGLRCLEKYAVRCGGGFCHRLGLHDAVLIKDNHIAGVALKDLASTVAAAALRARKDRPDLLFIEAEVDSLEQLRELLTLEPGLLDIILLDNMNTDTLRSAVALRDASKSRPELEASGGVNLNSLRAIAQTGVDRISVGTLTHGAASLDVALDVVS